MSNFVKITVHADDALDEAREALGLAEEVVKVTDAVGAGGPGEPQGQHQAPQGGGGWWGNLESRCNEIKPSKQLKVDTTPWHRDMLAWDRITTSDVTG